MESRKEPDIANVEDGLLATPRQSYPNAIQSDCTVQPDQDACCNNRGDKPNGEQCARIICKLKPIRIRYTSTFTMHALAHIINKESTRYERIFWTMKLITVFSMSVYLNKYLFLSYFRHCVDTVVLTETKTEMQLPMVFVCGKHMEEMLRSHEDCLNDSKRFNEEFCRSFQEKCPAFCKEKESDVNCSKLMVERGATCDPRLYGQCIVLNINGSRIQSLKNPGMQNELKINESYFPLWVYMKPPGHVELMPNPGIEMKWTKIQEYGSYHFSLDQTLVKKLPYPYNWPKYCVQEDSPEAKKMTMFKGNYSEAKCLATCWSRAQLTHCGSTFIIARVQVKDELQESVRRQLHALGKTPKVISSCLEGNSSRIDADVSTCSEKCPPICEEEMFTVSMRFERGVEHSDKVKMLFYYPKMTKKTISQKASYHFSGLIANFGGTLGLMIGMSAISVVELVLWLVLFLVDRCYQIDKTRKQKLKELQGAGEFEPPFVGKVTI